MADFMEKELKASFKKLIKEKPLNKITVNDIVDEAGVNRNSFYYHFKDIPDILEKIIMDDSGEFIKKYNTIETVDDLVVTAYTYALERRKSILNVYSAMQGRVYEKSALKLCENLVSIFIDSSKYEINKTDKVIVEKYLTFTLFGTMIAWIIKDMPEEELSSIKRVGELMKKGMNDLMPEITYKENN